ncbi:VPLPA-CTERM-specific exosortase XrtD [Thiocapsa bogorovii]|uniref:VPLPA-CTERM-specific exosortase XrtD n=1 Tax=Thiocapsa bogorovii TaxID=521689 RepID=UPI001E432F26|nr:VPLPA-CTERM-specific exosortase XrtD [Thiocapsa bogorovii]UHD16226.1 VPLPA-CTERM-specific exosortase XrtD [Thiocapsa bogorovii]
MTDSTQVADSLSIIEKPRTAWRARFIHVVWMAIVFGLLVVIFHEGLTRMVGAWGTEEYSHGYMLPFVALFFAWQKSTLLAQTPFQSSWAGIGVALLGLFLYLVGELGTIYALIQYSFLLTLGGVLLSLMGWKAFKIILPAYGLLWFLVPLPHFLYNNLSAELQLISSQLGVAFIRAFGITVHLEGNVIDLGSYQLQVVEACSGLRYLFPLAALGYIAAVIFKGAFWKKVILLLSTLPITVLMNSFRIGVIGILVEHGGIAMAEGFIHDFEGWVVFMACAALLVLLMWLLAKVGPYPMPLQEAFAIQWPDPLPKTATFQERRIPVSFYAVLPALALVGILAHQLPDRVEVVPERTAFLFFPNSFGDWVGRTDRMERVYVDALQLDDYLLSDYRASSGESVNLYVAYYESQRKGASVHSPKTCLPGGGWQIREFSQVEIPGAGTSGSPLRVNRSLIQMGDERLLVYYWFQQRGRLMTNEYLVKWYLFWDALVRNRTDGALVRLTVPLEPGQDAGEADELLRAFSQTIADPLRRFIPE